MGGAFYDRGAGSSIESWRNLNMDDSSSCKVHSNPADDKLQSVRMSSKQTSIAEALVMYFQAKQAQVQSDSKRYGCPVKIDNIKLDIRYSGENGNYQSEKSGIEPNRFFTFMECVFSKEICGFEQQYRDNKVIQQPMQHENLQGFFPEASEEEAKRFNLIGELFKTKGEDDLTLDFIEQNFGTLRLQCSRNPVNGRFDSIELVVKHCLGQAHPHDVQNDFDFGWYDNGNLLYRKIGLERSLDTIPPTELQRMISSSLVSSVNKAKLISDGSGKDIPLTTFIESGE